MGGGAKVEMTSAFWDVLSRSLDSPSGDVVSSGDPLTTAAAAGLVAVGVEVDPQNAAQLVMSGDGVVGSSPPAIATAITTAAAPAIGKDAAAMEEVERAAMAREAMASRALEAALRADEDARDRTLQALALLDEAQGKVGEAERRTERAVRQAEEAEAGDIYIELYIYFFHF